MKKIVSLVTVCLILLIATWPVCANPNRGVALSLTGPFLADGKGERVYVGATDEAGSRWTAVLSSGDGALSTTFDVGGPMALDASRGRLYVSTANGVVALDTGSGQVVRTLPAVPATTWRAGSQDFLPPVVVPQTGEVLVVAGPKVTVFGPDGTQPSREIPFTSAGFEGSDGAPLVADEIVFDAARGLLYGSFLIHSQVSSGIGGSFTVYEVDGLDVKDGQIKSQLETYNLDRVAVDSDTGHLLVITGGNARLWAGGKNWSAELKGLNLVPAQGLSLDAQGRSAYAKSGKGFLLKLDLDSLDLRGFARLGADDKLLGCDPVTQNCFLVSGEGQLSVIATSALGSSFATAAEQQPAPSSPVRAANILPDGRVMARWENDEIAFSSDEGAQWSDKVPGGSAMAVSPQFSSDNTLLAALDGLGIFRSQDGGKTWQISSAGLGNFNVDWIVFSPSYAGDRSVFLYARTGLNMFGFPAAGELYRSQDGGTAWSIMPTERRNLESVAVSDADDGTYDVVAVRADGPSPGPGSFFVSSDGGVNWTSVGATPAFPAPGGLSLAPLYAKWGVAFIFGTDGILYRSQDSGKTWSAVLSGTPADVQWGYPSSRACIVYGPDIEAGRPVFLVLRWNALQDGATQVRGAFYVSQDGGQSWTARDVPNGKAPTAVAVPGDFVQSGRIFLGLSDGGLVTLNWSDVSSG